MVSDKIGSLEIARVSFYEIEWRSDPKARVSKLSDANSQGGRARERERERGKRDRQRDERSQSQRKKGAGNGFIM